MVYIKARPNGGFLITVSCGRDAQDHKISKSVTMFTGCRRGELIALRWSDIDFESSSVKVSKSTCRTNGKMITKTTKTGATREIAVPELICKMARQWQIEQLRQQLCCHTFDFSEGRYSDRIRAAGACQCIHNTEYIQPCAQRIG